jgi:type 1 glutamine amidotransferase
MVARVLLLLAATGMLAAQERVLLIAQGGDRLIETVLAEAARRQFEIVAMQDAEIEPSELARCAAVVLCTAGEGIALESRAALFAFVRDGGGFVGVHGAADAWHDVPEYGELLGAQFADDRQTGPIGVLVEDREHPATALLGARFSIDDVVRRLGGFDRERARVLLRLDPGPEPVAADTNSNQPLAWCREHGRGRVFYTALGHQRHVWRDPRFLEHLTAGIRWAIGEERLGRPPAGATVLFDGQDTAHWRPHHGDAPIGWQVEDGALVCVPGTGSIVTREAYGSCRVHVEFRVPASTAVAQANSGVYVQERYEVQILDSWGLPAAADGCGGLYRKKAPAANVCRPPGAWQGFDIGFTAPTFAADGKKVRNARFSVVHNGVLVHDDVELDGKTGAGRPEGPEPRPLLLQDHGHAVAFRNLWIVPQ